MPKIFKMARIVHAANPQEFNIKLAEALKRIPELKMPEWMEFVKSGVAKKRVPEDEDFWYKRSASILRQLYLRGVVGVGSLRTRYGSKKDRGMKPEKFKKASGKIIRAILQQAELAGLIEKISKGQHGRRLTQEGRNLLDSIVEVELKKPEKSIELDESDKLENSNKTLKK